MKERLLGGTWKAGELIPTEVLKKEFGTSKQPIMEAMRRLAGDDLIEIIPQVGCRVPVYAPEEIDDFFTIFASVEAETTAVAALRRNDSQIEELLLLNERIGRLSAMDDVGERARAYRSLNREFHAIILEMTHSLAYMRTMGRMWDMSDMLINASRLDTPIAGEIGERHAEHERIIEAIRQSDPDAARMHMRPHILRNIAMLENSREISSSENS